MKYKVSNGAQFTHCQQLGEKGYSPRPNPFVSDRPSLFSFKSDITKIFQYKV